MPRCAGTKPDGSKCTVLVARDGAYCYFHDPGKQEARRRNAAKGGRSRWSGELADVRSEIRCAIEEVRSGSVEPRAAGVVFQGFNTLLRCIELERGSRLEQLEVEMADLEERIAGRS